ncbi:hypothetical protein CEXT_524651 [Caerostris extrusa]|uniref:Uncharacterized protein n=1 Tax=Caerostris extrusa TaxID=172846 RepID=A0AAV4SUX7_CAEEX|nr:hypothetical protein CEXT_524651 [Caerostris extrusa]
MGSGIWGRPGDWRGCGMTTQNCCPAGAVGTRLIGFWSSFWGPANLGIDDRKLLDRKSRILSYTSRHHLMTGSYWIERFESCVTSRHHADPCRFLPKLDQTSEDRSSLQEAVKTILPANTFADFINRSNIFFPGFPGSSVDRYLLHNANHSLLVTLNAGLIEKKKTSLEVCLFVEMGDLFLVVENR